MNSYDRIKHIVESTECPYCQRPKHSYNVTCTRSECQEKAFEASRPQPKPKPKERFVSELERRFRSEPDPIRDAIERAKRAVGNSPNKAVNRS